MTVPERVPDTAGRLRIASIADPASVLEIGGRAHSQQPATAERTPADGLHTSFATIGAVPVMIVAESADVLARTDAEVARAKLHRALTLARDRSLPVIVIADGPAVGAAPFPPAQGELHGRMADPRDATVPHTLTVAVVVGALSGPVREVAGAAHVSIGVGSASDIEVADLGAAAAVVRSLLHQTASVSYPHAGVVEVDEPDAYGVAALIADAAPIAFTDAGAVRRSFVRVAGAPMIVVAAVGPISHADLSKVGQAIVLAHRIGAAVLFVQHCGGYDDDLARDVHALAAHNALMRAHPGLRLGLVVGDGHVLGTFALGGRRLDLDLVFAWPRARLAVTDPLVHSVDVLSAARQPDPWLAAGLGLIDDVITPGETRGVLHRVLALAANSKGHRPHAAT